MKIGMVSIVRPHEGSGAGMTEYTYQISKRLVERNDVKHIYALDRAKKDDTLGLLSAPAILLPKIIENAGKDFDILHITNHEIGSAALFFKLMGSKAKIVTTIHDVTRVRKGLHSGTIQGMFNQLVIFNLKCALKYSDFVLFNSEETEKEAVTEFGRVKKGRVILLGVDNGILKKKIKDRKPKGAFVIGYLGAFAVHKNVVSILHVANLLRDRPEYQFRLYGNGAATYKRLIKYKTDNGLESVKFMGPALKTDRADIYDGFDAFVFPSLSEGFGLPILEAQARGLPVIVYNKSNIPKAVRKYCLEAEDEKDMARIIQNLKQKGYNETLKRKATAYARSFTWDKTVKETLEVYGKLLEK